jgi:hypothetical protein
MKRMTYPHMNFDKTNGTFNNRAKEAPKRKYINIPKVNWGFPNLIIFKIVSLSYFTKTLSLKNFKI